MMDLDERRESDARIDAVLAARPLHVRVWWWFVLALTHARECLRDALLIARGRPLYVRCADHIYFWSPCRKDATHTIAPGDMPIECAEHYGDGGHFAGRWYRAPEWEKDYKRRLQLVRPVNGGPA
jgi:hypothetical protein